MAVAVVVWGWGGEGGGVQILTTDWQTEDPDEMAHNKSSCLDLHCLQSYLFALQG